MRVSLRAGKMGFHRDLFEDSNQKNLDNSRCNLMLSTAIEFRLYRDYLK